MTARRRGRPPRAETRATRRFEVWMTDTEAAALLKLAHANHTTPADVLRLGAAVLSLDVSDDSLPLTLNSGVVVFVPTSTEFAR